MLRQGDQGCPPPALSCRMQHWALCCRPAPCLAAASSWNISRDLQHILVLRGIQWSIAKGRAGSFSNSSSSKESSGAQSSGQARTPGSSVSCSACAFLNSHPNNGRAIQLPQVCQRTAKGQGRDGGRRDSQYAGMARTPTPCKSYSIKQRPQRSQRTLRNLYKLPGPVGTSFKR